MTAALPVLDVIDDIRRALSDEGSCVLVAPPGTGKTTGVPPELIDEPWLEGGRIVMLEPRRLAASASASRMAATHGERVGRTFGYSVRGESRTSSQTRVEVVTEGLFLRRIQNDPELNGIGLVVLDEFHERSVDADLVLALINDVRASLRPDLRVVVMSATMDPEPVVEMIGGSVVSVAAPTHPVDTRYRPGSVHVPLEERVADVALAALAEDPGDILVFLPGRNEIRRTHRLLDERLRNSSTLVVDLHGSITPLQQQAVIEPDPGTPRRVILATSIAETSITIPGVRVVIDSGRRRTNRVDPNSGLPALVTVPVSRAGADQRRGRAGRTAPGVAYRLWSREDERHRPEADAPEILSADLSPLLLQLRAWGVDDPSELTWLDAPPANSVRAASELLVTLGAMDADGRLTGSGRDSVSIGFHPRLAAMAISGVGLGHANLAAEVCALVETSRSGPVDLMERLDRLDRIHRAHGGNSGADAELQRSLRQWEIAVRQLAGGRADQPGASEAGTSTKSRDHRSGRGRDPEIVAHILLAGYPDRVALRRRSPRSVDGRSEQVVFQMRTGGEFTVPPDHQFGSEEWLIAADLDHESQRLHLGVAVAREVVLQSLATFIEEHDVVEWNDRRSAIDAKRVQRLGAVTISERTITDPPREDVLDAVTDAFRRRGLALFGRLGEADGFRSRVALVRRHRPNDEWPDLSDQVLIESLTTWIGHRLGRVSRAADLDRIDIVSALRERFRWDQLHQLDELTPSTWELASGRRAKIHYDMIDDERTGVVARVRLRDAFGTDTHPMVVNGSVPVTVELLSPAGRPVQRTDDLPGFWRGSYRDVRSDLRGRYPKHPWPEEPWKGTERR